MPPAVKPRPPTRAFRLGAGIAAFLLGGLAAFLLRARTLEVPASGGTDGRIDVAAPDARPTSTVNPAWLAGLRAAVADHWRAKYDEQYREMVDTYQRVLTFGGVSSLPPEHLRFVLSAPFAAEEDPPRAATREFTTASPMGGVGRTPARYLARVPATYCEGTPLACVLVLPSAADDVEAVRRRIDHELPPDVLHQAIAIAPVWNRAGAAAWTSEEGLRHVGSAISDACRRFDVDRGRLILDGDASDVAGLAGELPSLFAGLVRRGSEPFSKLSENAMALPTLEVDSPASKGDRRALVSFVADTRKSFTPREFSWTVASPLQLLAYWLTIHPTVEIDRARPLRLSAAIDRERNAVDVTADASIGGYTLYLNDAMLDLDRPVVVTHAPWEGDGERRVVFEGEVSRSLDCALETWYLNPSGNLGEAYVAAVEIDVGS